MLAFVQEKNNRVPCEKPLEQGREPTLSLSLSEQSQPTCGVYSGNRTWIKVVGGDCSHHCATSGLPRISSGKLLRIRERPDTGTIRALVWSRNILLANKNPNLFEFLFNENRQTTIQQVFAEHGISSQVIFGERFYLKSCNSSAGGESVSISRKLEFIS